MRQRIASALAVVTIITGTWLMSGQEQKSTAVNDPGPGTERARIVMAVPAAVKDEPVLFSVDIQDDGEEKPDTAPSVTQIAMNTETEKQGSVEKTVSSSTVQNEPETDIQQAPKTPAKVVPKAEIKTAVKPQPAPQPAPDTARSKPLPVPAPDNQPAPEQKDPASRGSSGQTKMEKVLSIAYSLEGTPYVRGGSTPKGFDCSGFTSYVFRLGAGVSLPRTSSAQATVGKAVSRDELEPGDIVYFNTNGKSISHVGIYVGNNSFIHASYTKGITVTSLSNSYYVPRYLGARRVL